MRRIERVDRCNEAGGREMNKSFDAVGRRGNDPALQWTLRARSRRRRRRAGGPDLIRVVPPPACDPARRGTAPSAVSAFGLIFSVQSASRPVGNLRTALRRVPPRQSIFALPRASSWGPRSRGPGELARHLAHHSAKQSGVGPQAGGASPAARRCVPARAGAKKEPAGRRAGWRIAFGRLLEHPRS
jgi:hypothetical protein